MAAIVTANPKSITTSEFYVQIAEATGMSKAEVKSLFDGLRAVIAKNLGKKGPGVLMIPGLVKLTTRKKPAVKGGKVVPNRFKPGETTITKNKPAKTIVRARILKQLSGTINEQAETSTPDEIARAVEEIKRMEENEGKDWER